MQLPTGGFGDAGERDCDVTSVSGDDPCKQQVIEREREGERERVRESLKSGRGFGERLEIAKTLDILEGR